MGHRWWLAVLLAVLALAIIVAVVFFVLPAQAPAPAPAEPPAIATATAADAPIGVAARAGWYELYSNNPRYPDDPSRHAGGLDAKLVALIDRAEQTLDVADYDFDLSTVAEAMARAKQRGVQVRMVTDSDTVDNNDAAIQAALETVESAGIPIVEDNRVAIMHNKFTVVDGEWVSTGSWNYTEGDTYRLNNWMGMFHSKELAANYTAEFNQMFEQRRFGGAKVERLPNPTVTLDATRVQTCFSPEGACADLIIETIEREAKQSIQFMAFSFTHDAIGKAMRDKAKAGVPVSGVFENTGSRTQFSEYGSMRQAGLDVLTDGNPYPMHHKVIVIDGRISIAGSFNFSANADEDNDENLLIFDDPGVAQFFQAEFERVRAVAENPPQRR